MSYQYNKLVPSTIQQKKQKSQIFGIKHTKIHIEQIQRYGDNFIYFKDIQELEECNDFQLGESFPGLNESQYLNNLFLVLQQCNKFKKYLIIEHSPIVSKYINNNSEFKGSMILFVSCEVNNMSIQEFYFQYRQLSKQNNIQLIIRTRDIYQLLQRYPFEVVFEYYKRSNKYIQSIYMSDFDKQMNQVPPFEGVLFELKQLHISISLFYYMLKQNFTFIFDFKDEKKTFQSVICNFQQHQLDLAKNYIQIYDIIIASIYQDKFFFEAIETPNQQKNPQFINALNRYKTKQSIMVFIYNISNQQPYKQIFVYDNHWFEKNTPNEVVKYLISSQIPTICSFVQDLFAQIPKTSSSDDLQLKQLIKFAIPTNIIIDSFKKHQIPQLIEKKTNSLFTLKQAKQALNTVIKQIKYIYKQDLKYIESGQLARQLITNFQSVEIVVPQTQLDQIIKNISQIKNNEIAVLQITQKIVFAVKLNNKTINIIIYPYNPNNKGVVQLQISSVFAFWLSICKYAQKQGFLISNQTLTKYDKIIPVKTEKQFFSIIGLKFIEPQNRISFQISDKYIKNKETNTLY